MHPYSIVSTIAQQLVQVHAIVEKIAGVNGPLHTRLCYLDSTICYCTYSVADLHSKFWTRIPPGVQILSISCSFWENLAKSYVGGPPWELATPPRGNPGSATGTICFTSELQLNHHVLRFIHIIFGYIYNI